MSVNGRTIVVVPPQLKGGGGFDIWACNLIDVSDRTATVKHRIAAERIFSFIRVPPLLGIQPILSSEPSGSLAHLPGPDRHPLDGILSRLRNNRACGWSSSTSIRS